MCFRARQGNKKDEKKNKMIACDLATFALAGLLASKFHDRIRDYYFLPICDTLCEIQGIKAYIQREPEIT